MAHSSDHHCDTFDLIRALAATAVCVSHLRNLMFVDYGSNASLGLPGKAFYFISNYGHTAVIVFFVLSGYFVGGSVIRQVEMGTWSWRHYLIERLSRLWIVLLPALALTCFWDQMGLAMAGGPFYRGTEGNFDQRANVAIQLGQATFLCNAVFLQTLACGTYGSNGPLWSLANEFWYYLWFPACYALIRYHRSRLAWLAGGLAAATMAAFHPILGGFGLWLLGALLASVEKRMPSIVRNGLPLRTMASGIVFAAVLVATRTRWLGSSSDPVIGAACFCFCACILWEDVRLRPKWLSQGARLFASFSYSLYLTHFPFLLFVVAVGVGHRTQLRFEGLPLFSSLLVGCYLYAYLVFLCFERNTKRAQRGLARLHPFSIKRAVNENDRLRT